MSIKQILVLPHVEVHEANSWSSPYTSGFPSVAAFGGAVHALQRRINEFTDCKINLSGFGIISHNFSCRQYREKDFGDVSIVSSANPLDKNGERPSFVPEIKCCMNISLLCEIDEITSVDESLPKVVQDVLRNGFRIASGEVVSFRDPYIASVSSDAKDKNFLRYIVKKLMPGYALIDRRELMIQGMEQGQDALDVLLDYVSVNVREDHGKLVLDRKEKGWLVPISVGYAGISQLGTAINQRDPKTPHRFVESVISLGEFKMIHHFNNIDELLWRSDYSDKELGLYGYKQSVENRKDDDFEEFII